MLRKIGCFLKEGYDYGKERGDFKIVAHGAILTTIYLLLDFTFKIYLFK